MRQRNMEIEQEWNEMKIARCKQWKKAEWIWRKNTAEKGGEWVEGGVSLERVSERGRKIEKESCKNREREENRKKVAKTEREIAR